MTARLILSFLLSGLCASADDWPQWRGPARDGISAEKGLLDRWPEGGPPLAWEVSGLGSGYASVAVADGRRIEHWLNGEKLLEYEIGSEDWNQRLAASKFKDKLLYARAPKGRICLQDHSDRIEYRNLKIRPIPK